MSITIRSAQTIRNGVTIRGNDTQIPPPPPTIITDGLVLHYDFSDINCYGISFSAITDLSTAAAAVGAGRLRFRYNKADQVLTYSGTAATTSNPSCDNYYLGGMGSGPSNQIKGQIGEYIIWTRALKVGEVAAVETYLGTKWGI